MAAQDPKASLDALQLMFNDVLIQTGKALRASRKDAPGNINQGPSSTQFKLPDTMRSLHSALDDLENEIVRAKSVMQRDRARLQASKASSARPQPVESQSKSPMVIDLDSSPPRADRDESAANPGTRNQSVAPFPDMGSDLPAPVSSGVPPTDPSQAPQPPTQGDVKAEAPESTTTAPPTSSTDQVDSSSKPNDSAGNAAPEAHPELSFTTMQFTLAQPENGIQGESGEQSFDLTTFAPADAGNDSLDDFLPQNSTQQASADPLAASDMPSASTQNQPNGGTNELNDTTFDALTMDFGAADGTDFDFSMDDGNSFNDLMNSHEQNFDTTMEHGQFDADFFGLDKPDGT